MVYKSLELTKPEQDSRISRVSDSIQALQVSQDHGAS